MEKKDVCPILLMFCSYMTTNIASAILTPEFCPLWWQNCLLLYHLKRVHIVLILINVEPMLIWCQELSCTCNCLTPYLLGDVSFLFMHHYKGPGLCSYMVITCQCQISIAEAHFYISSKSATNIYNYQQWHLSQSAELHVSNLFLRSVCGWICFSSQKIMRYTS